MQPRAIWAIGCGQLVNWGVLFFAYSILLVPLQEAFDAPRWLVAGAFSTGLLVSAIAAPAVGRLADRGQGPAVMQAGGLLAAGLLIVWALLPSIAMTYVVWAALGLCMAAILYEPVFVIVGRAYKDADARLRAIATVTVTGGLASTVFFPGTSALVTRLGWRETAAVLAVIIAITTILVGHFAFRDRAWSAQTIREAILDSSDGLPTPVHLPGIGRMVFMFALSIIVNSAVSSNLVASLIDRGVVPTFAATVAGTFGIMQLPGRVLLLNARIAPKPAPLLLGSFALQIAGLVALLFQGTVAMWAGVMLFASGAGLTTLGRPYLVLHQFGAERAGRANGVIARGQQLARAAGPVAAAAAGSALGYNTVYAALGVFLIGAMFLTRDTRDRP
ncbi:MAG TPA: MFS transporter [Vicinamibacterales bacterium]|nr:MFS transporter [Vicinamibacterales bacterium]